MKTKAKWWLVAFVFGALFWASVIHIVESYSDQDNVYAALFIAIWSIFGSMILLCLIGRAFENKESKTTKQFYTGGCITPKDKQ